MIANSITVIESAVQPQNMRIILVDSRVERRLVSQLESFFEYKKGRAPKQYMRAVDFPEGAPALASVEKVELIVPVYASHVIDGYMLMGPRSSGEVYSSQDLSFLVVAARNIGLAFLSAKSFQEVEALSNSLQEKVREATKELRAENSELQALHGTKDDFISMTSHQLRPKITASAGFLELLSETNLRTTKEQSELLALTAKGIARMRDIVVDMLDVSKMSEAGFSPKYGSEKVDMVRLVKDEVDSVAKSTDTEDRFTFHDKTGGKGSCVCIDAIKIREVVSNILNNALQYSRENTPITVSVSALKYSLKVAVNDHGIGMTKQEIARIEEKFYRSDRAKRIRPTGSGVGLYVVKQIVDAHGGALHIKSQKGKGSTIWFSLPVAL